MFLHFASIVEQSEPIGHLIDLSLSLLFDQLQITLPIEAQLGE